jgi:signal peptidase I
MILLVALVNVIFVVFTAVDAGRRGRSPLGWAVIVAFTGAIGLVAYLVVRRSTPVRGTPVGLLRTAATVLGALACSALAAIVLSWTTWMMGQVATVEGRAMEPTLADGGAVLVNKFTYHWERPHRGDVVMLYYPVNPDKRFVMRVIAEEADLVRIDQGKVFVNDRLRQDDEVAPAARAHDSWGPQIVPMGYCFVMGDRRNDSSDSRHWGMVPRKYVIGRVALRLSGPGAFTFVK